MQRRIMAAATSLAAVTMVIMAAAAPVGAAAPAAAPAGADRLTALRSGLADLHGKKTLRVSFATSPSGAAAAVGPPVIDCTIVVHNPHISTHVTTRGQAKVTSQVTCTAPVGSIATAGGLYRDTGSNQVGSNGDFNIGQANLKLDVTAPCVTGAYVGQSIAGITAPPDYLPPYGEIYATSNAVFITC